jgi:hypothetical protein
MQERHQFLTQSTWFDKKLRPKAIAYKIAKRQNKWIPLRPSRIPGKKKGKYSGFLALKLFDPTYFPPDV